VSVLIEACVDSVESAVAAVQGGAHRLELCENLSVGGTTPSAHLLEAVKQRVDVPVFVMIRARGGDFEYSRPELQQMHRDIDTAKRSGADGYVFGVLRDTQVDVERTRELVGHVDGAPVTFHRAFDLVDQHRGLELLVDAGVQRVLTSGGASTALAGAPALRELLNRAGARIVIMAGGTVRAENVAELIRRTGAREVHARCELDPLRIEGIAAALRAI